MEDPKVKEQFQKKLDQITKSHHDVQEIIPALALLHDKIFLNIQNNPQDQKYRTIKTDNEALKKKLFNVKGIDQLLNIAGFQLSNGSYTLPDNKFMTLMSTLSILENHISHLRQWNQQKHQPEAEADRVKEITDAQSQELTNLINSKKAIIIDFHAEWCPPCRKIKPLFHTLSTIYKTVNYVSVEGDKNPIISGLHQVKAFPTFVVYKDGKVLETFTGANEDKLKQLSEQLK